MYNIGQYTVKTPGRKRIYDHNKIKKLLREGKQDHEIAEIANCPLNTVIYVRRKLGILRTTWGGPRPNVDVAMIKELYLKGEAVAQIAAKMHCSKTTVYWWLQLKKHKGIVEVESCPL